MSIGLCSEMYWLPTLVGMHLLIRPKPYYNDTARNCSVLTPETKQLHFEPKQTYAHSALQLCYTLYLQFPELSQAVQNTLYMSGMSRYIMLTGLPWRHCTLS